MAAKQLMALAVLATLSVSVKANAQSGTIAGWPNSQFGNGSGSLGGNGGVMTSGSFGQRNMGGTLSPTPGSFSGGQIGGMRGGTGSIPMGNGPLGFENLDAVGTGQNRLQQSQFIGSGAQNGFIGAASQVPGGMGGQQGQGGLGMGMGMGGMNNRMLGQALGGQLGGRQNQNRNSRNLFGQSGMNQQRNASRIRPTYTPAIAYQPAPPALLAERLSSQLASLRGISSADQIQVEMQGGTAILRGEVATDHQRALAAKVALLHPGVSKIQNDLVVVPAESSARPVTPSAP